MSIDYNSILDKYHQKATLLAENALQIRGFQRIRDTRWVGSVEIDKYGSISIEVELSSRFPSTLPDIYVDYNSLQCIIPHVEASGKICLVEKTGILLDVTRPADLMNEALDRAKDILTDGLLKVNVDDITDEFEAYWINETAEQVLYICEDLDKAREIKSFRLKPSNGSGIGPFLFAESRKAAELWSQRAGWKLGGEISSFLIPFTKAFLPPTPLHKLTYSEIRNILQEHTTAEVFQAIEAWLNTVTLPIYFVFVMPLKRAQGKTIVGVKIENLSGQRAKQARKGFRKNRVPATRLLNFQPDLKRLQIERLDPQYLLPRGGANTILSYRSITVIGCGAVGSYIINHAASLGIGRLHIIDADILTNANIHRHVLGANYLKINKAKAMAHALGRRFPHLQVDYRDALVEDVLRKEPSFITDTDLIIIAIGEPTIELMLNELLGLLKPRLHVWVEPLGIGAHILATGISKKQGCYHCIYEEDEKFGLVNKASFAAPGQRFQRTMGGCAGQFIPFAGLDADRIAGEAVRLASQILTEQEKEHVLISVREDEQLFREMGYQISLRAKRIPCGVRHRETAFVSDTCPVCIRWNE
jgi:Dinucleotide-utilizing enzymes involved in molybdopterin and thiamine biosynthesis family 2